MEETYGPAVRITVPSFVRGDDNMVKYHVQQKFLYPRLTELKSQYSFQVGYRYSELRRLYESLSTLKVQLPKFPGTKWWLDINSKLVLIEERRQELDRCFQEMYNLKPVRDSLIMKNFICEVVKIENKRLEKEAKVNGEPKKKLKSKYNTPACQPVYSPVPLQENRERSQSYEEKQADSNKKGSQHTISYGGTKIFRGILTNTKS